MQLNILKKYLILLILAINGMGGILYGKIKIIFPDINSSVNYYKKIHIVGISDKRVKIFIKVNDFPPLLIKMKEEKKVIVNGGVFYLFKKNIDLNYGLNYIQIKSKEFEENFYIEYNDKYEGEKKIKYFHMNEKTIFCKKCHDFNKISECKTCHIKFSKGKYIHGPVVTWQCFTCHDKNNYFTTIQPVYIKCLKCHQEFNDNMFNAKFAHAPSVTGNCNICHTPHVSQFKFFLKTFIDEICLKCHKYKADKKHILKKKKSHESLSCVKCHNPHYGDTKFLFVNKTVNKKSLCKRCH